jgi:type IV pilus assembly protein PilQ
MHSFLRVLLLGVFAAAGVGLAVSLALYTQPPSPDGDQSPAHAFFPSKVKAPPQVPTQHEDSASGGATVDSAERDAAKEHVQPASAPPVARLVSVVPARPDNEANEHPLQYPPYQDAVSQQIQQLHETLVRAADVTKQSQLERIEKTLDRVQEAAQQNERILNAALTTMLQTSRNQPAVTTVSQVRPQENEPINPITEPAVAPPVVPKLVAQANAQNGAQAEPPLPSLFGTGGSPNGSPNTGEEAPEPLPNPKPAQAKVHKDEGDDKLTINTRNSDIREVLELLSEQAGLNILATKNVQGTVSASLSNVDIQTALDAILQSTGFVARREGHFIYVGRPEDLQDMDNLRDQIGTRIYRTNYVKASELQTLIAPLLTPSIGRTTVSSPSDIDIPASTTQTGGDDFAGGEVLLVRDYEAVLRQVDEIVVEVDQRPRQVAIEAMILSVNLKDTNKLGVNFELLRDKNNVRLVSGSPLASLANINVANGGLNFGFLDGSLAGFIDALETIGDTNVIAAPRLMCLNKQRAEILIGDQKGFVSTTQTETATTQTVEFLDVGTQLRIRPFISSDGMIRMEVHPELSTGEVQLVGTFALPNKTVTQVTTNIMCYDGCTVIIGGLIREDLSTTSSQIPFVGNLPVIGPAFRRKTDTTTRNEVIVLITPRIVQEPQAAQEGAQLSAEFLQRQAIYADKMSPIGKRHYGRRYLRLAQSAWEEGNPRMAQLYVNLALHFDPLNAEIISLRNEIVGFSGAGLPIGNHAGHPIGHPPGPGVRPALPSWRDPGGAPQRLDWPTQPPGFMPPPGEVILGTAQKPKTQSQSIVKEAQPILR